MIDLKVFDEYRIRMNNRIIKSGNIGLKRFLALDSRVYEPGVLNEKTKELIGLATSTVLKCDDCITYHIVRCIQSGASDDELLESLNIALIVGGSITIPHLRRAIETIDICRESEKTDPGLKSLL
jgi:AhpD family alkylhydroperoxidase